MREAKDERKRERVWKFHSVRPETHLKGCKHNEPCNKIHTVFSLPT